MRRHLPKQSIPVLVQLVPSSMMIVSNVGAIITMANLGMVIPRNVVMDPSIWAINC